MRVLVGRAALREVPRRAVVTVGVFDGLHVAHQQLIRTLVRIAKRRGGMSVVITFNPDPQMVLNPRHAMPPLLPLAAKLRGFQDLGVKLVWVIRFTRAFSRTNPETFVRGILGKRLRAVAVVVGEDFAFGKDRRGNLRILRRLGPRLGMRIVSVPAIRRGKEPVSSSRIRRLITQGRLEAVRQLLGRAYTLHGTVVTGQGRGRRLGIPTINVRLRDQLLPPCGVYGVLVRLTGSQSVARSSPRWLGAMNLGHRPTFGPGPLTCEAHLFGFRGTLVGRSVELAVLLRLRSERRFPRPRQLVRQIRRDLVRVRQLLPRVLAD